MAKRRKIREYIQAGGVIIPPADQLSLIGNAHYFIFFNHKRRAHSMTFAKMELLSIIAYYTTKAKHGISVSALNILIYGRPAHVNVIRNSLEWLLEYNYAEKKKFGNSMMYTATKKGLDFFKIE